MTDPLIDTGVRWCVAHDGIVDVDEDTCDFARMEFDGSSQEECDLRPLLYRADPDPVPVPVSEFDEPHKWGEPVASQEGHPHGAGLIDGKRAVETPDDASSSLATVEVPVDLLASLIDDEECWFDHHGGCQAHGYLSLAPGEKCPQMELRDIVGQEVAP